MNGLSLVRHASELAWSLAEFALPQRCPGCGGAASAGRFLCAPCLARLPRLTMPLCTQCLCDGREPVGCTRHRAYIAFAAWLYEELAASLVQAFKYAERPALARELGASLAAAVPGRWRRPDLILEVPLHPTREREPRKDGASPAAKRAPRKPRAEPTVTVKEAAAGKDAPEPAPTAVAAAPAATK